MRPVWSARRAEEFAALVEAPSTDGRSDARFTDLLELVDSLREAPAVEPRAEFVTLLRERLVRAADTLLVPDETARLTLPARRSPRDRRIATLVGGFALVGATTSMAMAAQSALPGDVLYPIKRAIENAEAGVSVGEGQKGVTLLENAATRLDEVSALSRGGDLEDAGVIADTLDTFTAQATEASDFILQDFAATGDQSTIEELNSFTALSLDELTTLEPLVPTEARDELLRAGQILLQIDAEARRACPSCGGTGIVSIPTIFAPVSARLRDPAFIQGTLGTPGSASGDAQTVPSGGEAVPPVEGTPLPPGSVLAPPTDTGPGGTTGGDEDDSDDPITGLTSGLTGGEGTAPTSNPDLPDPGDLPGGVGDVVDDTTEQLPDPLNP